MASKSNAPKPVPQKGGKGDTKKDRADRFTWGEGDVVWLPPKKGKKTPPKK